MTRAAFIAHVSALSVLGAFWIRWGLTGEEASLNAALAGGAALGLLHAGRWIGEAVVRMGRAG